MLAVHLAGLWVFISRFFWIRVLTEDQAVYLLPRSGCTDRVREGNEHCERDRQQESTRVKKKRSRSLTTVKDLSQRG